MLNQPRKTIDAMKKRRHTAGAFCARKFLALAVAVTLVSATLLTVAQADNCALDPTFDHDGKVITDFGGQEIATAAVLQPDGKIVAAGATSSNSRQDVALARYNTDGSLDATFGNGGKVITDFSEPQDVSVYGLALQADGKLVIVGLKHGSSDDFALARYNTDGSLDDGSANDSTPADSFGTGGLVTTDFSGANEYATSVVIQPNGKIIAAGGPSIGPNLPLKLARYNTDGSHDATFGTGGRVITAFPGGGAIATSVILQPDGKIVVGGVASANVSPREDFALARYNPNGSLDTTFGNGGLVTTDYSNDSNRIAEIALQADGKIVAVGVTFINNGPPVFALARYNPNGSLDATFGNGGKVLTDFPEGRFGSYANAVEIQPADGKIVVGGFLDRRNNPEQITTAFAAARYNIDGQLDTSFDGDGRTFTDLHGAEDEANEVLIQPDGNIVLVGWAMGAPNANASFALVRYLGDAADYAPALDSLTLESKRFSECGTFTGTITLCGAAPSGGALVNLRSTNPAATVPSTVLVPEGETTATFNITITAGMKVQSGNIIAKLDMITKAAQFVVQPVGVSNLTLTPNPVTGPNDVTGQVSLNCAAPAGGLTVTLSSSNPAIATPTVNSILIPEGQQAMSFTVHAFDVPATRSATIKATANGTSKSRVLTVQ